MPPASSTETSFALEPFVPIWALVLIGAALLVLSWAMAYRDAGYVIRRHLVWLVYLFRAIAALILLWMLAGPTLVTRFRQTKKKAVAVLIDTSGSMGLVDVADGSGNVSRWSAANGNGRSPLPALDGAAATLQSAKRQLDSFAKLPEAMKDGTAARALLGRAVEGIRTGSNLLKTSGSSGRNLPPDQQRKTDEIAHKLEGGIGPALEAKSADFSHGKSLAALRRPEWLPQQIEQLSATIGTLQSVAEEIAKSAEKGTAPAATAGGNGGSRSRLDYVDAFLKSAEGGWLKELGEKATITRYDFGDKVIPAGTMAGDGEVEPGTKKPLSTVTDLGAALQQIALGNTAQPLTAAILITDGGQNAGRDPREVAPSITGTALHIVPIGNTRIQRDVILHHTQAPKAVLQNDTVVVDSSVTAYDCDQESLSIELREGEAVVDRQTLSVTGQVFDTAVKMRWKAAAIGKHKLSVRIGAVPRERTEENNTQSVDVQVMDETVRVLVADNFPRWETRYLLNLFKRDERMNFDQLLFEPQRVTGEGVRSAFPTSREEWSKYRVVVLGDVLPSQLNPEQQKLLHDYVSEMGGNLIIVAGKDAMPAAFLGGPIEPLLPVLAGGRGLTTKGQFYLHVDEASQNLATQIAETPEASDRVWREMSERTPIYSISEFSKPKPTTHSLIWASSQKGAFNSAEPTNRSFLSWHYVGAGRVVYLAAPLTYQLRYREGDTFHHRFWAQLIRWAVARELAEGSQTTRLSTDKLRYEIGEPVEVSAQLRQLDGQMVTGAALEVEASQADRTIQKVTLKEDGSRPGSYRATLPALPAGAVRLQLLGSRVTELLALEKYTRPVETTISIDPHAALELRNPLCNLPLLRAIADASEGMVVPPTGLEAAFRQLDFEPEITESLTKQPLWNRWDLFAVFLLCLTLEWVGRKYLGLS